MSTRAGKTLLRLYPGSAGEVALKGLYLAERLDEWARPDAPLIYANFLSSLDGRIALVDAVTGQPYLPSHLTTPDDFRLFQELQAHADCLITHGGYLRALAEGRLGNILQVGQHRDGGDLGPWRLAQGLAAQPDVVVASASLDFPLPPSLSAFGQKVRIATGRQADPRKVAHWREQGVEVLFCGEGVMVEGGSLTRQLGALGYRRAYLIAGPRMLDTMLREGVLGVLYQTITHQIMGGEAFRTLAPGPLLGPAGHLALESLYLDPGAPDGVGQWFARFAPVGSGTRPRVCSAHPPH